jgi:DHA1 family multidrug resistance protein B-like MFS transporter
MLITEFLSSIISNMIFPLMPTYLANHFDIKVVGVMTFFNIIIGIFLSFFSGYFSDTFGRKRMMALGEGLRFVAVLVMTICNSPWFQSPLITFLMMTVNTICWSMAGPASMALIIDYTTLEERKDVFSLGYWSHNLAFAAGSSFGGFLFENYFFGLLSALTLSSLFTFIVTQLFIHDKYPIVHHEKASMLNHAKSLVRNYREVFRDSLFILFNLSMIMVMSMEFQLNNYSGIRLSQEFGVRNVLNQPLTGVRAASLLRTENTVIVAVLALFAVRLVTRLRERRVIVYSSLAFVIGYAIISYSNNPLILFSSMLLASLGEVMRVPIEENYMASIPPKDKRSSYLALNGMTYNISSLICSFTIFISSYLGRNLTSIMILVIGLSGILILMRIAPKMDVRVKYMKEQEEAENKLSSAVSVQ